MDGVTVLLVTVAAFVAWHVGRRRDDVVRARRFELLDAAGRVRCFLGEGDGRVGLAMFDESLKERLTLQLESDGAPILSIRDGSGEERASITINETYGAGLFLRSSNDKVRCALVSDTMGATTLVMFGSNAQTVAIKSDPDSEATIHMWGPNKLAAALGIKKGAPGLVLSDATGVRAGLIVPVDGNAGLKLVDKDGNAAWFPPEPPGEGHGG